MKEHLIEASKVLDYNISDDEIELRRLKESSAWRMRIDLEIPKTDISPLSIEQVIREVLDKGFMDKDIPVGETPVITWAPRKVDWRPFGGE